MPKLRIKIHSAETEPPQTIPRRGFKDIYTTDLTEKEAEKQGKPKESVNFADG
ncbi:MAG: hypothetical protein IJ244_01790 [Bacteroidaceae bacterium]|nr:hypothetical protein [Bacteroidaceae bacterium]